MHQDYKNYIDAASLAIDANMHAYSSAAKIAKKPAF